MQFKEPEGGVRVYCESSPNTVFKYFTIMK